MPTAGNRGWLRFADEEEKNVPSYEYEYMLAIEKWRNLSKAAESLYVSQPALSRFLSREEEKLGVRLFERQGKRFILTYAGKRYLSYARQIQKLRKEMEQELAEIASETKGRLAIGYQLNRSSYMIPLTIPEFKAHFPQAEVELHEGSSEWLEKSLLDGTIDLVIYNYSSRHPAIEYELLEKENVLLITPKGHPLAKYAQALERETLPWIDLKLFAREPFILQRVDQSTGRMARALFEEAGISPPVVMETRSIEGCLHLVERGLGCAFMVDTNLRYMPKQGGVEAFYVGSPKITIDLIAAHRKSDFFPKYAEHYLKIVRKKLGNEKK